MSLHDMHENARRSDRRRVGGKSRRVARTNAKVRKMVRRKERRDRKPIVFLSCCACGELTMDAVIENGQVTSFVCRKCDEVVNGKGEL